MELEKKQCQCCSNTFVPKRRTRRYCYDCDVKTREKAARASKVKTKKCVHCSSEFSTTRATQKFCSKSCTVSFHTRRSFADKKILTECVECGTEFVPISKTNKTCSTKCSRARSYKRSKEVKVPKPCVVCATEFLPRRVLDVCCSKECSNKRARKAQDKEITCIDCEDVFTHSTTGTPKRCPSCRVKPKMMSLKPCEGCGKHFKHNRTDYTRFCSLTCATLGIHAEGLANGLNKDVIQGIMVEFIKNARHTPTIEEASEAAGVGENYHSQVLNLTVEDLFELAGRKNKSLFPSKFEERVYYSMLDLGFTNTDINRQKSYPGLKGPSGRWPVRFDFYINSLNLLVEADGEQHTMDKHLMFDCESTKACDALKDAYADEHGIKLVRIPYHPTFKGVFKLVSQLLSPYIQQ